jgi:hypothetical protein
MPEQQTGLGRLVTTEELARFETCRLAWWYDHTHPLARATPKEIARRLEIFEAVYGPGVRDLPEYQMLTHLREQAKDPLPAAMIVKHSETLRPGRAPRGLLGCVGGAVLMIVALVVLGIVLSVMRL